MKTTTLFLTCCLFMQLLHAQSTTRFVVETGASRRVNIPVNYKLTLPIEDQLQLVEIIGTQRKPVPFQLSAHQIYWLLDGINEAGSRRIFELSSTATASPAIMQVRDSAGSLILQEHGRRLMQYNYATVYPPAGIDSIYRRSGFIHPLWAPDGQILTNIHPEGHWHHVGIWNPWTHTEFEGKETDFWNLQKKEGTVRFISFLSKSEGAVWCGFKALQDHIAIKGAAEKVALHEVWDVRAYNSGTDSTRRIWDFTSTLSCAGSSPLQLLQYRYGGGFAFRATAAWNATNSKVLTSEGKTRINADSTRARWIKITGRTADGQAGILILCAEDNYDFPQPLRVWPENNERGEIMMNYSPTKMKSWQLLPGNEYIQRYRIMVYINDLTVEEAENAWQAFAHPPVVKVLVK
ncbi:Methane oxygenase PmoA [Chitinophaga sp. CF118]|uniref:DUF6807 domain-containing protein n=1 Tax=Chitinophaga sp. CF118 TaxID=1884367 RepID=UPI0008EA1A69|nr:PmoA family protein [Chitinophaga sp. CF118]SFE05243.1 Methane oxygenase PmoA [Chitinophaga sp. CF118]